MADIIPRNAEWIQVAASGFDPEHNRVHLSDSRVMGYRQLIACPGIRLAWEKIEGLEEALGKNGVTSNYQYDLAPYTWSGQRTQSRESNFYPAANADQMYGRTTKGHVSLLRSLDACTMFG